MYINQLMTVVKGLHSIQVYYFALLAARQKTGANTAGKRITGTYSTMSYMHIPLRLTCEQFHHQLALDQTSAATFRSQSAISEILPSSTHLSAQ